MLAQIDEMIFETDSNIKNLSESYAFNFAKVERIGNNATYQDVNGYEQELNFSGYFVLKSLNELDTLISVAKRKKVVFFVQKDISFEVIITALKIDKSLFLKHGEFIKQGFEISLKRFFR